MKNCAEIDRLMTPYVDDEVDTRTRRAVQAHLVDCPPCRERADAERTARRIVRSHTSTLTRPAPAALRAKCVCAVPSSGTPAPRPRLGLRVRRWVPLSMAATLLLAVAGVFMMGQQERLEAAFVAQLAIDHQKCFTELGTGHPPLNSVQAAARLATLGIEVSVPTADDEWIALVDVRSCDYDGGPMAHLLYEVDGQSFSLFVVPKARHGEGTFEVLGQQEHLWLSAGEACVLVGPQDAVAMDEVIAYVRAISER
jgi:anti-sigma factor RsiW